MSYSILNHTNEDEFSKMRFRKVGIRKAQHAARLVRHRILDLLNKKPDILEDIVVGLAKRDPSALFDIKERIASTCVPSLADYPSSSIELGTLVTKLQGIKEMTIPRIQAIFEEEVLNLRADVKTDEQLNIPEAFKIFPGENTPPFVVERFTGNPIVCIILRQTYMFKQVYAYLMQNPDTQSAYNFLEIPELHFYPNIHAAVLKIRDVTSSLINVICRNMLQTIHPFPNEPNLLCVTINSERPILEPFDFKENVKIALRGMAKINEIKRVTDLKFNELRAGIQALRDGFVSTPNYHALPDSIIGNINITIQCSEAIINKFDSFYIMNLIKTTGQPNMEQVIDAIQFEHDKVLRIEALKRNMEAHFIPTVIRAYSSAIDHLAKSLINTVE